MYSTRRTRKALFVGESVANQSATTRLNQTHRVQGDFAKSVLFQDCQVEENSKPLKIEGETMCEETCQIFFLNQTTQSRAEKREGPTAV